MHEAKNAPLSYQIYLRTAEHQLRRKIMRANDSVFKKKNLLVIYLHIIALKRNRTLNRRR